MTLQKQRLPQAVGIGGEVAASQHQVRVLARTSATHMYLSSPEQKK